MLKIQFKDRRQDPVWLVDQVFSIGSDDRNSLVIKDQAIAQFHLEIRRQGNRLSLHSSTPGALISLNQQALLKPQFLKAGDCITLADVELELIDPKKMAVKASPAKAAAWRISSKASWLDTKHFDIEGKKVLGRDPSCDIVLPLEHLSRRHLELEVRSGLLFVRDLDSSNGTFVNGERISQTQLQDGDKIRMDLVSFEVSAPSTDPNKTIVRKRDTSATQNIPKTSSAQKTTAIKSNKAPKKRLAAAGKQDWIQNDSEPENKQASSLMSKLLLGGVMIAVAACAVLVLKQL